MPLELAAKTSRTVARRLMEPRAAPPVTPHVNPAASDARGSAAAGVPSTAAKGKGRAPPPPRPVNKSTAVTPAVPKRAVVPSSPAPDPSPEPHSPSAPPSVMEVDDESEFEPGAGYEVLQEYLGTAANAPTKPQSGQLPASGPMYILREIITRVLVRFLAGRS